MHRAPCATAANDSSHSLRHGTIARRAERARLPLRGASAQRGSADETGPDPETQAAARDVHRAARAGIASAPPDNSPPETIAMSRPDRGDRPSPPVAGDAVDSTFARTARPPRVAVRYPIRDWHGHADRGPIDAVPVRRSPAPGLRRSSPRR